MAELENIIIMKAGEQPLRILTWHVHGSYLYYLTQTPVEFYLPVKDNKDEGYGGKTESFPWGTNVHEIPADKVKDAQFDIILYQSQKNYLKDRYEILSASQLQLPQIYLEHDPPRLVPTDTQHAVDDKKLLIVHVTHFNNLMWNNNNSPSKVIEHGVIIPDNIRYTGELEKGIVVINGIAKRGRRLGLDIFEKVRKEIPLDIVGMGSKEVGGLGEVKNQDLPKFISKYRFFFNPIRYTSLGLSVCEAMMVGLPIVGLATTEMPITIQNNFSGYIHTNVNYIIDKMSQLLIDHKLATELGMGAKTTASTKFGIERFKKDWLETFKAMANKNK